MTGFRRLLARGPGLRARMTASYVLVTCAAVILVEALAAALVLPDVNQEADLTSRVVNTANQYAKVYGNVLVKAAARVAQDAGGTGATAGDQPAPQSQDRTVIQMFRSVEIGDSSLHLLPAAVLRQDAGLVIPQISGTASDREPVSLALILGPRGQVYASSYPARFRPGSDVALSLPQGWSDGVGRITRMPGGSVAWASQPILQDPGFTAVPAKVPLAAPDLTGKGGKGSDWPATLGYAYVQVPVPPAAPVSWSAVQPLVQAGVILLLMTLPVGVVFGMLTTRGTIRRLRRLAAGTVGFAGGDFSERVPESREDEVGQLERHFNRMAGRLADSIAEQRSLAERNARLAERSRISRELHDSISQDLFSMNALVGGLRKALPRDSPVQPQLATLGDTVGSTIREMRALLLELRPTALEEKGLVPALADLCQAYEVRVGVRVRSELEPVSLDPAAEQAVFRIAQEGLSNAVRHSDGEEIEVRLRQDGGKAELTVADRGRGFDPGRPGHGLGLRLMAERVRELGGSLAIESAPGRGTRLRVLLPAPAGG